MTYVARGNLPINSTLLWDAARHAVAATKAGAANPASVASPIRLGLNEVLLGVLCDVRVDWP